MNAHDVIADLDPKHGVFVNGRGLGTASMFEVHDPATREVIAEISDGTASDATSAVEAAARAFPEWAATAPRVRAEILRRAFDLMVADTDRLVALICAENGKPQADARAEVAYAAEFFRWYSEEAVRTEGTYGVSPGGVRALIAQATAEGAVIAHQASAPTDGWYVAPTLLACVHPDAAILRQEIFGPVAPIVVWDNEDELLDWINDTEYGLAAYIYTIRLQDALRIGESIDAGMVGINRGIVSDPSAPFGGTKQSGLGREGGRDGMREFQETQYFSVDFV